MTFKRKLKNGFFIAAGTVSLGLGIVGIILPVLPTTPFLLLSAACYARGSERMHAWLLGNRVFGKYIQDYLEGRGISARVKVVTILFLWAAMLFSVLFVVSNILVRLALLGIAMAVSAHIGMVKAKRCKESGQKK